MKDIEDVSCIKFKKRHNTRYPDYIEFKTSLKIDCGSSIGRNGGRQELYVNENCSKNGLHTITHEVIKKLKRFESRTIEIISHLT